MPQKKKEKGKNEEDYKVDLGFGKLNLGGIFKGLGNFIDILAEVAEKGKEFRKESEFEIPSSGGKKIKGVYGFSINTLGGAPRVETFGNIKRTPKGPVVEEVREPIIDVFDEGKEILVIAELPGVQEQDVKLDLADDILTLNAENKDRKYSKEILLPSKVKKESMKSTYKNGILEIRMEKV